MLDTWFMLVVHYGKTIVEWRKAGYHLQPDQDAFRFVAAFTTSLFASACCLHCPLNQVLEIRCACNAIGSQLWQLAVCPEPIYLAIPDLKEQQSL